MTKLDPLPLAQIQAAAARIRDHHRRTPTLEWTQRPALPGLPPQTQVLLKLEQLQLGGSFKLRGALNALLAGPAPPPAGVFTASGGNHGIGVALAARQLGVPCTVFLPTSAPQRSEERLVQLGARVVRAGAAWDHAYQHASTAAAAVGGRLVHPFDDPLVIAGQGTLALELLEDHPQVDLLLVAVGGGGLLGGTSTVLRAQPRPRRVGGVGALGSSSMAASAEQGQVVRLPEVRTIATTLAPLSVSPLTLQLCQERSSGLCCVSDDQMRAAMALLWDDLRLQVEPAGAAALAALLFGAAPSAWLVDVRSVAVLLCGANA